MLSGEDSDDVEFASDEAVVFSSVLVSVEFGLASAASLFSELVESSEVSEEAELLVSVKVEFDDVSEEAWSSLPESASGRVLRYLSKCNL